jgi:hypothetical protein
MKLFVRLILDHVRAVMLLRNQPAAKAELLAAFSESMQATLTTFATAPTTPLNSHLLLRLLTISDQTARSPIPHLPLEIAIVEITSAAV